MFSESRLHRFRLGLVFTAAPLLALTMQALAYADVPWACRGGSIAALHIIAAIFALATALLMFDAYTLWRGSGGGTDTSDATPSDRSRFLALSGLALSLASLLLILGMWAAVFVFDPCVR